MRYRRLGSSDVVVSELGLGSWLTLGRGVPRATALALVDRALGLGITLFDTAPSYDGGAAETLLGEALAGRPRESYVLATKLSPGEGAPADQLEGSLARLRTEYVDVYQCRRPGPETALEHVVEALSELVREGKVRSVGVSGWSPAQLQAAAAAVGSERLAATQAEYSILARAPERGLLAACRGHGLSLLAWSPLGQGVLTGKYRPGQRPGRGTRADSSRMGLYLGPRRLRDDVLVAVERLRPVAEGLGVTLAQLALGWVLRERAVASALTGATRPEQLDENAAACELELEPVTLSAIDEAVAGVASFSYA